MRQRLHHQAAYVLHTRPWSETSLLVDVFSRQHGRLRLLAKGARRQKTGSSGELLPFQPLEMAWSAGQGLAVMTSVEISAIRQRPVQLGLGAAYYANELILKMLHQHDPHPELYDAYDQLMIALASGHHLDSSLRTFECELLGQVGYGLQLACDAETGLMLESSQQYFYYPEKGPVRTQGEYDTAHPCAVSGDTLLQLAARNVSSAKTKTESKQLIRHLISRYLNGKTFRSRRVFNQILQYQKVFHG